MLFQEQLIYGTPSNGFFWDNSKLANNKLFWLLWRKPWGHFGNYCDKKSWGYFIYSESSEILLIFLVNIFLLTHFTPMFHPLYPLKTSEKHYIPENFEMPVQVLWLNSNKFCKKYNIETISLTLSLLIRFNYYYVLHPYFHVIGIF